MENLLDPKIPSTPGTLTLGIQSSFLRQGNWRLKHYVILIIWDKRSLVELVEPSASCNLFWVSADSSAQ